MLVQSPRPGAITPTKTSPALAGPWPPRQPWLVPSPGPGADRFGSSRHPGPEPYRPQRLVPLLQASSCVDRIGSSRATRARSPIASAALARPVYRPGAVSVTGHFCAEPLVSVCLALTLRWAETSSLLRWAKSL